VLVSYGQASRMHAICAAFAVGKETFHGVHLHCAFPPPNPLACSDCVTHALSCLLTCHFYALMLVSTTPLMSNTCAIVAAQGGMLLATGGWTSHALPL